MHRFGRTKLTKPALPGRPFLLLAARFHKGGSIRLRVIDCPLFVPLLLAPDESPFDAEWVLSVVFDDAFKARVVWSTTIEGGVQ